MTNAPPFSPFHPHAPGIPGLAGSPSTPLLGREKDVEAVLGLLDSDAHRVVSLLGPGGIGKTRLAEEVTRAIAPAFAHGAYVVRLDSIRNPDDLPEGIADRLGLQQHGKLSAQDRIDAFLRDRHLLLVLDNLEQVIGSAAQFILHLLDVAPRIRILVTSRIPLHIASEQQFTVSTLDIAGSGNGTSSPSPAVMLFAERATAVRHDFVLDDATANTVAEICRQLDGLPLAIELAAARIKVLSPQALLARLTNRLTVLSADRPDVPPRLRSMRDAIAWSYELLTPEEGALFRRLSVFLGGFTLEAAEFVSAWPNPPGSNPTDINTVQALADKSLIQVAQTSAGVRYRMLETIREYGLEQVDGLDEDIVHYAHAGYVLDLAHRAERALIGPDQALWLDALDADMANIRAAVSWLERTGRIHDAIAIYAHICTFLDVRGHTVQVIDQLETWLKRPELQAPTRSRALLLHVLSYLLHAVAEFQRGVSLQEEALGIFLDEDDLWYASISMAYLGTMYAFTLDTARADATLQHAVELASAAGHHRALAHALFLLADHAWGRSDETTYRIFLDRAYRVARDNGDLASITQNLLCESVEAIVDGRLDDAETIVRESLRIRTELRSKRDLPADWMSLSGIARARGDLDRASARLTESRKIIEETGHAWYRSFLDLFSALLEIDRGDVTRAYAYLQDHVRSFQTHQRIDQLAISMAAYALLARSSGDADTSAQFLGASNTLDPEAASSRVDPFFRIDTSSCERDAIARIGKDAFRTAYETGASWSPDDAIAAALGYRPALPDIPSPAPALAPTDAGLSPRERDVLVHMAKGLSNQDIADALFISYRTVTTHVTGIMTKLDAPSRTAAVAWAIRSGIA